MVKTKNPNISLRFDYTIGKVIDDLCVKYDIARSKVIELMLSEYINNTPKNSAFYKSLEKIKLATSMKKYFQEITDERHKYYCVQNFFKATIERAKQDYEMRRKINYKVISHLIDEWNSKIWQNTSNVEQELLKEEYAYAMAVLTDKDELLKEVRKRCNSNTIFLETDGGGAYGKKRIS